MYNASVEINRADNKFCTCFCVCVAIIKTEFFWVNQQYVSCHMYSRGWHSYMFSRASHWLHVFPRFTLVTGFPALGTGYRFSRVRHWLQVFPSSALLICFPALDTGYMFSHASHWLTGFPALGIDYRFSPARLALLICFPALDIR